MLVQLETMKWLFRNEVNHRSWTKNNCGSPRFDTIDMVDALLLYISHLDQVLRYLDRIQGGTLANLVTAEPEGESVLIRKIFTDATYEDIIETRGLQRHGIDKLRRIVFQCNTRSCSKRFPSGLDRILLICFMFFGRIGGLTLGYALASSVRQNTGRLPAENVSVG